MKKILVLNGPNLNLLGERETQVYGKTTLNDIKTELNCVASELHAEIHFFQTNSESVLIDAIHNAKDTCDGIILNPAAFTHTSIALMDAITAVKIPVIEVHLSNIHAREEFRHISFPARACIGQISGFGKNSYTLALRALIDCLH